MLTSNNISINIYEISLSDSASFSLDKMSDLYCKQLAVVDQGIFYGLIDEDQLLDLPNTDIRLEELKHLFQFMYLYDYQHIYDVLPLMSSNKLYIVPILDSNLNYLGTITRESVLTDLNSIIGKPDAAIICIELGIYDHVLSHISRIIEAEDTTIYSSTIHPIPNSTKLELTLQVNKTNISAVIAALWRHDYQIKATFGDNNDRSTIQSRYEHLMNYLDM